VWVVGSFAGPSVSLVHSGGQDDTLPLTLLAPITGEVTAAQPQQRWTFEARAGQVISAQMRATSGDLTPHLELRDAADRVLMSSRPTAFRTVAVEAYVFVTSGLYSLYAGHQPGTASAGAYRLILLPGHSHLLINDDMQANSPLRSWREPNASSRVIGGKLRMGIEAEQQMVWTTAERLGENRDVYAQVDFALEDVNAYWEVGLLLRGSRVGTTEEFYAFTFNSNDQWRVMVRLNGQFETVRDWTPAPVDFTAPGSIGVMSKGNSFTLFYNGQPVGAVEDDRLGEAGLVGLVIGSGVRPNQRVVVQFDNFIATVSQVALRSAQALVTPPATIAAWDDRREAILAELMAAGVIPVPGELGISLESAFVSNSTAGSLIFVTLMDGVNFTDLVYSADVLWDSDVEGMACGLEMRVTGTQSYTIVYLDRQGSYGVRQVSGGEVVVSEYARADAIKRENRATNRLLVVAFGNGLLVYINGRLITEANVQGGSGEALIVSFNYARANSFCGFANIWLTHYT
jgi:hypothetical protein